MPKNTAPARRVHWAAPRLKGKVFVFTGTRRGKAAAARAVKREGGKMLEAVTDQADYLVVGHTRGTGPTAAEKKAQRLSQKGAAIQVIDESAFRAFFVPTREEAVAMLRAGKAGVNRWRELRRDYRAAAAAPDLSGVDLRGADLRGDYPDFTGVKFDGADFRGADCTGAWFDGFTDARLDGACLKEANIEKQLVDCSLRNADLSDATIWGGARLERCDFSGADLHECDCSFTQASDLVFRKANLRGAELEESSFARTDFAGADLTGACLREARLAGACLARAILANADLTGAHLPHADLTRADLSGANLVGADLTGATIDGANFDGANLAGANLTGLDLNKARSVKAVPAPVAQKGPNLRELEKVARKTRRLDSSAIIALPHNQVAEVDVTSFRKGGHIWAHGSAAGRTYDTNAGTLGGAMLDLARYFAHGKLQLGQITAKASKGPLKGKELRSLAVAAWCEAFGIDASSPEALHEREQAQATGVTALREQMLAELRGGRDGVARWNERPLQDRQRAGPFRRADLSGAKLRGVHLGHLDFRGANFDGAALARASLGDYADFREAHFKSADLKSADLGLGRFAGANFREAALKKAKMRVGNFRKADFQGADLRGADLAFADLRGADLSSADLDGTKFERTKYDDHTRLPAGFEPPAGMRWSGVGPPPSLRKLAARQPAGPMEFAGFMQRLPQHTDAARLAKALKMLRAERFQLFAEAGDERLVGVVKSQTDPGLVYSCKLAADGSFGCCTQNLNVCGGLSGRLCKHLLVLLIGLAKAGAVDPARVDLWVENSRLQKPALDKDAMSETLLRYKGAEAGEIDWRPTETIPEDYYAL